MTIALPPLRAGRPAPAELIERRSQMQAAVDAGVWKTARPPLETTIGGVRALRFAPERRPRGHMLLLHGGGFRIGRPEFESLFAEALAERCAVELVAPQYRLAPEDPFPAGLTDALAALTALREEIGEAPLIVCGDSAGAGLAASLGLLSAGQDGRSIDALILLSPWLDLRVSAATFASNAGTDPLFSLEAATVAAELYLQGFDPTHPLASPLLATIIKYPPVLISVGTGEVLYEDARLFHAKLVEAGHTAQLVAVDGMEHVAVIRGLTMPGSPETFDAIAAFVDTIIAE